MNAAFPKEGIISTRLSRKGPLIEETFTAFQNWDLAEPITTNLSRLERDNPFGAKSDRWLREVTRTLFTRFRDVSIRPLVLLAQAGCPLDLWKPCLLWHMARRDLLYYQFGVDWLYPDYRSGVYAIRTKDLAEFVQKMTIDRLAKVKQLSDYGAMRLARDLLMAADLFGLIQGNVSRAFSHRHMPSVSFLYVAHAIAETSGNGRALIDSLDWRLFLLSPDDVEHELHDLHQFKTVSIDAAGSLISVRLPAASLDEFAEYLSRERNWNA